MRYALGAAIEEQRELLRERNSLTARMRHLRDPIHLARRARELGFEPPSKIIDLPDHVNPAPGEQARLLADGANTPSRHSPGRP